eukprot:scaffold92230_cov31-Cyclotella_meneghiniana.AAC.1
METLQGNDIQSQVSITIHSTHDETLERSRCCDMDAMIQSHTNWVWKYGELEATAVDPPINGSKVVSWRPFQAMISNLKFPSPFIILIMRHWNSQGAVIWMQ